MGIVWLRALFWRVAGAAEVERIADKFSAGTADPP